MPKKLVEVARSFSMKKNLGNYESVDFFASQKAEVPEKEAEAVSEKLYLFCKTECIKSYNEYLKGLTQPNDSEYGNIANGTNLGDGKGVFPKVYQRTDTELKDLMENHTPKYKAEKDAEGNTVAVPIEKEENSQPY